MTQVENVGKILKDYFAERGLTQTAVAEKLGTTQQVVGKLLNGKPFGKRTATAWADVFGFNPIFLLTGHGELLKSDMLELEGTTKRVVETSSKLVANEILKMISDGKLYPANIVHAKDELIQEKDEEIQRLNRIIGALENRLSKYEAVDGNQKDTIAV